MQIQRMGPGKKGAKQRECTSAFMFHLRKLGSFCVHTYITDKVLLPYNVFEGSPCYTVISVFFVVTRREK